MKNLYDLYYKQYYQGISYCSNSDTINVSGIDTINKQLLDARLSDDVIAKQKNPAAIEEQNITLEVAYPGLITGVGINHEIKGIDSEFKFGMHFDYTTGMPVIYGSTVKGVLRSYIKHYADEIGSNIDIEDLVKEIFDGKRRAEKDECQDSQQKRKYTPMSIYKRDIFFDAVIVSGVGGDNGRFLDRDTICPHKDNPLKNPIPITFMKIASGVKIEFRFKLNDGIINASEKLRVFKSILLDFGVGAKTNVGYGQFVEK